MNNRYALIFTLAIGTPHRYALEDFGLDAPGLRRALAPFYDAFPDL